VRGRVGWGGRLDSRRKGVGKHRLEAGVGSDIIKDISHEDAKESSLKD
jgi:hypothetical protein